MIDHDDIERLKEIFVTRQECATDMEQVKVRQGELEKSLAVLNTKMNWLVGILAAIAVPVLGIAIKLIFGGNG